MRKRPTHVMSVSKALLRQTALLIISILMVGTNTWKNACMCGKMYTYTSELSRHNAKLWVILFIISSLAFRFSICNVEKCIQTWLHFNLKQKTLPNVCLQVQLGISKFSTLDIIVAVQSRLWFFCCNSLRLLQFFIIIPIVFILLVSFYMLLLHAALSVCQSVCSNSMVSIHVKL